MRITIHLWASYFVSQLGKINKMRKSILLVAIAGLSFIFNHSLSAQEKTGSNVLVFVELGGNSVLWSENIEGSLIRNERLGFRFRLGVGALNEDNIFLPVGVNYIIGKQNSPHTIVAGLGTTFLSNSWNNSGHILGFFNLMYRFMPLCDGLSFQIGYTPYLYEKPFSWKPWFGIGIGVIM